jgi:DNA-binding protein HU-beta
MKKKEFLQAVAKNTNQPIKQVDATLTAIIDCITNLIAKDDKLSLPGLGIFSLKSKAARLARNIQTGGMMQIPAKQVPHFVVGKQLKDNVQELNSKKSKK